MSYQPVGGFISTNNSSTATLAGDAVFTGTGEDVSAYSSISITAISDVVAAASGLSLEFSPDNTNWDRQLPGHIVARASHVHSLRVINKFFRVVYTNGAGAQGSFRLQTLYHSSNAMPLITRTGQPQTTVDALPVRQTTDVNLDFARKHISGSRSFFFFGKNTALQNGVFEDVWNGGGDIQWQTAAAKVKVQSTNAADVTSTGSGLRSIEIHGLDANGADQDEVIQLNGVTAVESSKSYLRVSLVHNEEVGTYGGSHEGDIEVRVTNPTFSSGALLALLTGQEGAVNVSSQYGIGEAQNGFTSIPLGKVAYIKSIEVVPIDVAKPITIIMYEREGITRTSAPHLPRRIIWQVEEIVDPIEKIFNSHIKIKELTDLWFRAEGNGQTGGVSVWMDYYLIDSDAGGA